MPSTAARAGRNGTADQNVTSRAASVASDVSSQARATAVEASAIVAHHVPAALAASHGTVERALTIVRGSSSGSLVVGTAFAAGVSGGMLVSRAPRVLVALAWLPTLLLGGTLVGRGTTQLDEAARRPRT